MLNMTAAEAAQMLGRPLTTAEAVWLETTRGVADYQLYCCTVVLLVILYTVACLPYAILDYLRLPFFEQYRLQPAVAHSLADTWKCYKDVIGVMVTTILPLQLLSYPFFKVRSPSAHFVSLLQVGPNHPASDPFPRIRLAPTRAHSPNQPPPPCPSAHTAVPSPIPSPIHSPPSSTSPHPCATPLPPTVPNASLFPLAPPLPTLPPSPSPTPPPYPPLIPLPIPILPPLIAPSLCDQVAGIRASLPLPTLSTLALQLFVFLLIEDYGNYWIHRLFHLLQYQTPLPPLPPSPPPSTAPPRFPFPTPSPSPSPPPSPLPLRPLPVPSGSRHHGVAAAPHTLHAGFTAHHEYTSPMSAAATYAHWIEVLLLGVPTLVGPAIVQCHVVTLWVWILLRQLEAIETHSGYDFPWSPTRLIPFYGGPRFHDYHHEVGGESHCNFASIFTICDWLYGTDKSHCNFASIFTICDWLYGTDKNRMHAPHATAAHATAPHATAAQTFDGASVIYATVNTLRV
ncbi:unnamed protein product [Closterium sp. NIES-53]